MRSAAHLPDSSYSPARFRRVPQMDGPANPHAARRPCYSLVGSTAVRGRRRRTFIFMRRGVSALTRGLKAVLRITSTQ